MTSSAWIIGGRGLLGKAISRRLEFDRRWRILDAAPLPWFDEGSLLEAAEAEFTRLLSAAADSGEGWAIFWAAGVVVTSSPQEQMDDELRVLDLLLAVFSRALRDWTDAPAGAIFYASSAGGVYAGSENPPFDERSVPAPISPYGHFKLDAERRLANFSSASGASIAIGRISNLYGPGQSLTKMQGLISHIAKAQISPAPVSVYVPLDTLRDYLYVDDCAALVVDTTFRTVEVARLGTPVVVIKNIISGQTVTISSLLGYFRTLAKGHPHVILGSSAAASFQSLDLRLRSVVWPDIDRRELMPLPAGIRATMTDILTGVQAGSARQP
jgi:UDP-glucose 4-epimerase